MSVFAERAKAQGRVVKESSLLASGLE